MLLTRRDYTQVPGTSKGVLALTSDTSRGHLLIGDQSGALSLFNFDSLSNIWSVSLKPISHLEYSSNTVYASGGPFIYSYSTAGKEISTFDTNVAENVKTFKVQGNEIWTSGKYLFNHYQREKELNYLILKDTINDFCVSNVTGDLINNPILACNDKTLRILEGENTIYSIPMSTSTSVLNKYAQRILLCGSLTGSFGMVQVQREQGLLLWNCPGNQSEVTCLNSFDLLGTGSPQIVVSRSNGKLEIYSYSDSFEVSLQAELDVNENITSALHGSPNGFPEILVSTYSGKIFGVRDSSKNVEFNPTQTLNSEIAQLKQKLEESKKSSVLTGSKNEPTGKVSHSLSLIGEQAAYCLSIESYFAMSFILIQSEVPIELLDSDDHEASIVFSEEENQVLITYRFNDTSNTRCQILFRSSEGQPGTLNLFVIPYHDPKIAKQISVEIKPLALHEKVSEIDFSDKPLNTLKIKGGFSKSEMHGWISQTLPDVPPSLNDDIVQMFYSSCVVGSVLRISYAAGWAEFQSESASVLAILKESLMKHSSFRKVQLNASFEEAPESCAFVIKMIESFIVELQELETKYQLIEAMKEIEIQGDIGKFGAELTSILEQAEEIKSEYKKYPKKLQFFQGMVSDLYVDYCKFRGKLNFAERIPHLQSLLVNFDSDTLIEFFSQ